MTGSDQYDTLTGEQKKVLEQIAKHKSISVKHVLGNAKNMGIERPLNAIKDLIELGLVSLEKKNGPVLKLK